MSSSKVPISIKILGWLSIIGASWKLVMTFWSAADFELWRTVSLIIFKFLSLAAGFALIRGLKVGAYFYWASVIITTTLFYTFPPEVPGIEAYFSPAAIAVALVAPAVFTIFFILNWKRLT